MIEIIEQNEEEAYFISVKGEVDASSSIHLDNAIRKGIDTEKNILVDLQAMEYISSAGLGVFISYLDEINNKNLKMVLFGLSEKVRQVFEILGLLELLAVVDDKDKALETIQ